MTNTMYRHSRLCPMCNYGRDDYRHLRTCEPRRRWPEPEPVVAEETVLEAMGIAEDNTCSCGKVFRRDAGLARNMKTHLRTSMMHREEVK